MEAAKHRFGDVDGKAPDVRLVYSEESGFRLSGLAADEVHHAFPGSMAEANGINANSLPGVPVARLGHRGRATLPFEEDYSFHPDMEKAARRYAAGDRKAFAKAAARHKAEALTGNDIPGFDANVSRELGEMMVEAAVVYTAETGNRKPISTKKMPKPKRWYDGLF